MSYPDRFPPPWSVQTAKEAFIVRDATGFPIAYVYFTDRPLTGTKSDRPTRDRARQVAAGIARLPELSARRPRH